jgi:hypothetical protein
MYSCAASAIAQMLLRENELKNKGFPDTKRNRAHSSLEGLKTSAEKIIKGGAFMRQARFGLLAVLFWVVTVLSGCQAITGSTLGENIDDTNITTAVKSKLAVDKASSLARVGVETTRGTVQLTGVVDSSATRDKAAAIARSVGGVKNVVNNIQVK